jgi:serine/threonine protein kinase
MCYSGGLVAPELAEGIYTPAADVYSFGMTLIHIATNKQPFG